MSLANKVLIIAYHFPPSAEVSGALRTLAMTRYLRDMGVEPIVLVPDVRAYPSVDQATLRMIPEGCEVVRTFAFDARRHFGFRGRYPLWLAQPDRWSSWWLWGVPKGMQLIEQHKPRAIWSTYPISTAHLIAASLHRRTGIPWIADFRDPVRPPVGQERLLTARVRARVDRHIVATASACVFVTQGARELYEQRYGQHSHGPFEVIPNGFDEEAFDSLDARAVADRRSERPLVFVHSGVLYPKGRNPEPFFKALATLFGQGALARDALRVVLRASGSESHYQKLVSRYGLERVVSLAPAVSREQALVEQSEADALLLFQGSEFNSQVPAKVYEYFRVGRPIFALVDEAGDTARLVHDEHVGETADINDPELIARRLVEFIGGLKVKRYQPLAGDALSKYSRKEGACQLLRLIDRVAPR